KSGARLAIILVSLLVAGMVTFGIILATRKTPNSGSVEAPAGGSGTAIAATAGSDSAVSETAPVALVNDAALPDADVVAVAPADAGTETPKKDANVTKPGEK